MSWEEKLEICKRDIHIVENFQNYTFEILNKKYGFGINKYKQFKTIYKKNRLESLYERKEWLEERLSRKECRITEQEIRDYRRKIIKKLEQSGRTAKEVREFFRGIEYEEITRILGRRYTPKMAYSDREMM